MGKPSRYAPEVRERAVRWSGSTSASTPRGGRRWRTPQEADSLRWRLTAVDLLDRRVEPALSTQAYRTPVTHTGATMIQAPLTSRDALLYPLHRPVSRGTQGAHVVSGGV